MGEIAAVEEEKGGHLGSLFFNHRYAAEETATVAQLSVLQQWTERHDGTVGIVGVKDDHFAHLLCREFRGAEEREERNHPAEACQTKMFHVIHLRWLSYPRSSHRR